MSDPRPGTRLRAKIIGPGVGYRSPCILLRTEAGEEIILLGGGDVTPGQECVIEWLDGKTGGYWRLYG